MLKQGLIEFDLKQIESIHRQQRIKQQQRRRQIQEKQQTGENHQKIKENQYSIVKEGIFPSKFTPFFIDTFTKQSALQIYQCSIKTNDIQKINQKINTFYQTINSFQQIQRQQLFFILQVSLIKNFSQQATQKLQQRNINTLYFSYFEEGKIFADVQNWRFKHRENNPQISYQSRQQLFQQLLCLLKFINTLTQKVQFQKITFDMNDIIVEQKQSINQSGKEYRLKLKLRWIINNILGKKSNVKSDDMLSVAKKMVIKLLSLQQQKQEQSKQQQYNLRKIQELKSIDEIIKLKYQDFYPDVKKVQKKKQKPDSHQIDTKQLLQKIKHQIIELQEKAKQEIKQIKTTIQAEPKIIFVSQQSKNYFWNQINKIIIKNLTQNQRKNIILTSRKSSQSNQKSQNTKDNKSTNKQLNNKQLNKSLQEQVIVQAKYLSSGSYLKFMPDKLITLIETKNILYVIKVYNKNSNTTNHLGCYVNSKVSKENIGLFGSYFEDPQKKSFIYSENKDMFFPLSDKNHSVGYGPQIFLSIGKLDIIVPCFGTQIINKKEMLKCLSYFPISYSPQAKPVQSFDQFQQDLLNNKEQQITNKDSFYLLGLQGQFFLQDIDIYEISFKVT